VGTAVLYQKPQIPAKRSVRLDYGISGDTLAVGATFEASSATGIDGKPSGRWHNQSGRNLRVPVAL